MIGSIDVEVPRRAAVVQPKKKKGWQPNVAKPLITECG